MAPSGHLQQSAKRPKNPPRFKSTDAVPQASLRPGVSPLGPSALPASSTGADSFVTAPSTSPRSTSLTRSNSGHRKPAPSFEDDDVSPKSKPRVRPSLPPSAGSRDSGEISTLNFGRRISNAVDPTMRDPFAGGPSFPPSRQLVGGGTHDIQHAQRPLHSRRESVSLKDIAVPAPSPKLAPGELFSPTFPATGKIDMVPSRTRAPMEAFASIEMMEGARAHADRTRGQEVFRDGRYEGRASVSNAAGEGANAGGLPSYQVRRADPNENSRAPQPKANGE